MLVKGVYRYFNGDLYEGAFKDGKRGGKGVYTFGVGGSYTGDFKEGAFHGKGVLVFPDGSRIQLSYTDDCAKVRVYNIHKKGSMTAPRML